MAPEVDAKTPSRTAAKAATKARAPELAEAKAQAPELAEAKAVGPEAAEPVHARIEAPAVESTPAVPTAGEPSEVTRARRRQDGDEEGVVIVTGVVGRLGQLLVRVLHRDRSVVGIDRRDFPNRPKDVVHHPVDLRRKKTRDVFRAQRVDAVVHLGVMHDPRASDRDRHTWNVVAFQKLLDYVAEFEVPKLVVLSSANVYGPQPENPQFLTEEAPLLGSQSFRSMRDLVEMDMLAQSFFWRHPTTETVILRPVHILGRVRNAPSNYLRLERPVSILGFDPMIQVIHERDVVDAIVRALEPGVRGIFNVRGPGELPLSRIFRMLRKTPLPVPAFAAKAALDRLWNLRLTSFPSPEIDYIRFVCMVDDARAREVLGFRPRYGLDETVRAVSCER
ncbi:MAG: NAD-dependent epimerase/dehydratase family protein [Sandaracinus sp.]|nr:NAD-dependent epimerase/dehydratase family protein [Sandaracinus sp.]